MEYLFKIIEQYPEICTIIFSSIGVLFIFLIYLISVVTGKTISFIIGPIKLNLGKKYNELKDLLKIIELYNDYCRNKDSIEPLLFSNTIKIKEKERILLKEIITQQMLKAEDINLKIKHLLTNRYSDLLKKKNKNNTEDEIKSNKDYRFFQITITSVLDEIKRNTFKPSLEINSLLKYNDSEFNILIEQKSEIIVTIILEYIDFMYNISLGAKDDIIDIIKTSTLDIKNLIKEFYIEARNILFDCKSKVDKLDISINNDLKKYKENFELNCLFQKLKNIIQKITKEGVPNGSV